MTPTCVLNLKRTFGDALLSHGGVGCPPDVVGEVDGQVVVDLVEPGCEPLEWFVPVVQQQVFRDVVPWVVIRICRNA